MTTTAIDFRPGQRVLVRLGVNIVRDDERFGLSVSYIGQPFRVEARHVTDIIDLAGRLVQVTLPCVILRRTGKASFLVNYQGRELPVMEQAMRAEVQP